MSNTNLILKSTSILSIALFVLEYFSIHKELYTPSTFLLFMLLAFVTTHFTTKVRSIFLSTFGLFLYEYIALKKTTCKPTVFLLFVSSSASDKWRWLGKMFGIISSFLAQLDINDIKQTLINIFDPVFGCITSPGYFLKGYSDYVMEYLSGVRIFILIGSVILVGLIYTLYVYYGKYQLLFSFAQQPHNIDNNVVSEEESKQTKKSKKN